AAGEKLTATSTGDLTGDFAWESADDSENFDPATATWTPIASGVGGENNSELTIGADADLVGKRIRVKRGDSVSEPTEPVAPADGSNPLIQGIEGDRTYTDAGLTAVE
ncbi:MAG: hypothetical protein LBH00_11715, partial [Planctomycetaceae bacterium]|nr:hypothetical protein [Planctomycetaceae bacterium]